MAGADNKPKKITELVLVESSKPRPFPSRIRD